MSKHRWLILSYVLQYLQRWLCSQTNLWNWESPTPSSVSSTSSPHQWSMSRGSKMENLSPLECRKQSSCQEKTTFSANSTISLFCPQLRMSMTARWSTGVWTSLFSSTGVWTNLHSLLFYNFLLWCMCWVLWDPKYLNYFIRTATIQSFSLLSL